MGDKLNKFAMYLLKQFHSNCRRSKISMWGKFSVGFQACKIMLRCTMTVKSGNIEKSAKLNFTTKLKSVTEGGCKLHWESQHLTVDSFKVVYNNIVYITCLLPVQWLLNFKDTRQMADEAAMCCYWVYSSHSTFTFKLYFCWYNFFERLFTIIIKVSTGVYV